ncbi:MAG: hypothetical protein HC842_07855 [Cytophagales bacterium]|nr:hypothetical protein [Cytophagales bacterium]
MKSISNFVALLWALPGVLLAQNSTVSYLAGGETNNIDYAAYQSAGTLSGATSRPLISFEINDDDSGNPDSDPTKLAYLRVVIENHEYLRSIVLMDGDVSNTSEIQQLSVNNDTLEFVFTAGNERTINDGASRTYTIRASFTTDVVDNERIIITVDSARAASTGSSSFGTWTPFSSSTSGDANKIEVTATKLVLSSVPTTVNAGITFSATVRALDATTSWTWTTTLNLHSPKTRGAAHSPVRSRQTIPRVTIRPQT